MLLQFLVKKRTNKKVLLGDLIKIECVFNLVFSSFDLFSIDINLLEVLISYKRTKIKNSHWIGFDDLSKYGIAMPSSSAYPFYLTVISFSHHLTISQKICATNSVEYINIKTLSMWHTQAYAGVVAWAFVFEFRSTKRGEKRQTPRRVRRMHL